LRPLLYILVERILGKVSEEGRLEYILDTLDHCPYDNLKVAVIGTLKKQISGTGKVVYSPSLEDPPALRTPHPRTTHPQKLRTNISLLYLPPREFQSPSNNHLLLSVRLLYSRNDEADSYTNYRTRYFLRREY